LTVGQTFDRRLRTPGIVTGGRDGYAGSGSGQGPRVEPERPTAGRPLCRDSLSETFKTDATPADSYLVERKAVARRGVISGLCNTASQWVERAYWVSSVANNDPETADDNITALT
jgi:hypothetical protein